VAGPLGGMDGELDRREPEDQPSLLGVDRREPSTSRKTDLTASTFRV
jgi:hypothetical protein